MRARLLGIALAASLAAPAAARAQTFSTSFEFDDPDGFSLESSPFTATFSGGKAEFLGIGSLYRTGIRSFIVDPGGVGTIAFETPAASVTIPFKNRTADGQSLLTVKDAEGAVLAMQAGSDTSGELMGFTTVTAAPEFGEPLIDSVTLANASAPGSPERYAALDDFSWTVDRLAVCGQGLGAQVRRDNEEGLPFALSCLRALAGPP